MAKNASPAEEIEKQYVRKDIKKKSKMKVSGKSVFQVKRIKDKK